MMKSARGDLNGFLDEGSHIKGELHFEDTFKISGKVTRRKVVTGPAPRLAAAASSRLSTDCRAEPTVDST